MNVNCDWCPAPAAWAIRTLCGRQDAPDRQACRAHVGDCLTDVLLDCLDPGEPAAVEVTRLAVPALAAVAEPA